jgi:hypothetical protein
LNWWSCRTAISLSMGHPSQSNTKLTVTTNFKRICAAVKRMKEPSNCARLRVVRIVGWSVERLWKPLSRAIHRCAISRRGAGCVRPRALVERRTCARRRACRVFAHIKECESAIGTQFGFVGKNVSYQGLVALNPEARNRGDKAKRIGKHLYVAVAFHS